MDGDKHPDPAGFKRPESVLVVVHARDGQVLMLRRRQPDDFWQSVTGSLEWGETPVQAACRELQEETGLSADGLKDHRHQVRFPIVPPWRSRYAPGVEDNLEHQFSLCLAAPVPIHLNPSEHLECRWLPRAEAARLATSWSNARAILDFVPASPPA
ncbi:dihydroneopterin triphosphate diphosphatase [Ectothiorhodospira shaposhnikovii]|uniref:dihydroneopterin triphosphate diphosphatase n=1 Tax=Ectothiorhodospira shaposhnikovii TaxID=1054 RepID=UPI001904ACCE|nr:dihydroneopterin triphosphate diphosphatase [Ectothiorhodospira shaposhnikovii]MBK1674281.1 dihydroneopterin triphosphate diphosphatase [Ectothiorhodospira shaposhnikovii]